MTEQVITQQDDEHEIIASRRQKLHELRAKGEAYPNTFHRDNLAKHLLEQYQNEPAEKLLESKQMVMIAGRLMLRRIMGKASFIHLQDMSGRIQVYVRGEDVTVGVYEEFKKWDIGDIVGVCGFLFKTKTGELSIHAQSIDLLSKALRPLPDKFHGLHDKELCYRQRYLDLMMNDKTRETFIMRSKIIKAIRQFMDDRDFLEVETPMMQTLPGGAAARPFITHHNTLDMDLYLRIAPELYLKRLVVGGFERVYEINRNFRNEGISTRHNPEFTMLEFYQAYADYRDLLVLTEEMIRSVSYTVLGKEHINYQGEKIDFSQSFHRLTLAEALLKYNPQLTQKMLHDFNYLQTYAQKLDITVRPTYGLGKIQLEIFEKTVESQLLQPTFITGYPTEVSPLARKNDADGFITDRFEFFVAGREIANGFSELNDPEDQAGRFQQQVAEKEAGDLEAMSYDEDYITALEYGLPPTAGEGIGIDRLVMLFTDSVSIRDVILFPHMRP